MKDKIEHAFKISIIYAALALYYLLQPIDWIWSKYNDYILRKRTEMIINNLARQQEIVDEFSRLIARIQELESALGKSLDYCDAATHGDDVYEKERSSLVKVWKGNKKPLSEKKDVVVDSHA